MAGSVIPIPGECHPRLRAKVKRDNLAPWLKGDVMRHCIICEAMVDRMDRTCPVCSSPLLKECPRCHYLAEMDTTFCISCRYAFPLPAPEKATIKMWHAKE